MYSQVTIATYEQMLKEAAEIVKASEWFGGLQHAHVAPILGSVASGATGAMVGYELNKHLGKSDREQEFYRGLGAGTALGGVSDPEKVKFLLENSPEVLKMVAKPEVAQQLES